MKNIEDGEYDMLSDAPTHILLVYETTSSVKKKKYIMQLFGGPDGSALSYMNR